MCAERHDSRDLIRLFDRLFMPRHHTRLVGGAAEPLYTPARGGRPALIQFRADWFASALHEVAHWCIAGARRRRLSDYGYWYAPDGRDAATQARFEAVEVAPQALEWLFADAAGHPFRPSLDNLATGAGDTAPFLAALRQERARLLGRGLPPRAAAFRQALCRHYAGRGS